MISRWILAVVLAATATAQVRLGPQERPPWLGGAPVDLMPPIARWDDGLPLGNGALGALVWGADNVVRISLDRGDLWDERIPDTLKRADWTYAKMRELVAAGDEAKLHELFDVPYDTVAYPTKLPVGRIELEFPKTHNAKLFQLDMARAEVVAGYGNARVRVHVSATLPLVLVRVDNEFPEVVLVPPSGTQRLGYEPARLESDGDTKWFVQQAANGLAYAVACRAYRDERGVTFAITVTKEVNGDPRTSARAQVELDSGLSYDKLLDTFHLPWWRASWKTSWAKLPDAPIQAQYDLARYCYAAGSRADQASQGGAPLALQGLWTADDGGLPPWKGDFHNDLNTQMTYAAYPTAGYFDSGACFLDYLVRREPRFREFAASFYGVDGLIVPGVMAFDGAPLGGWGQYSLSPTNSAWLVQLFYLHWRYTLDPSFLADNAYRWCAHVGTATAALLRPDDKGLLRLPLSSSPEIFDNSMRAWLTPNSNYDLALMRSLFAGLEEMASALKRDEDAAKWSALLAKLEPLDVEDNGALTFARGVPYRESHRHFSHAMAIHPLGLISIEGGAEQKKTVEATLAGIEAQGTSAWCGYSFSWFACMCARAGQSDKALDYLEKYLSFTGRNGFHLNGDQSGKGLSSFTYRPFTLEGNFLAMQAVHEMLLQSWGGVVRIFPATSARWGDVQFDALRAEGAFQVSARREGGATKWISITAHRGGRLVLRNPFGASAVKWSRENVARAGDDWIVALQPGEKLEGRVGD